MNSVKNCNVARIPKKNFQKFLDEAEGAAAKVMERSVIILGTFFVIYQVIKKRGNNREPK
ncbi:hypothetical protein [Bacillus sp. V5-8f]|uniref:hypothetical protein n=1 Tax=Bacillus sp. V5-8f TaxID=2053044 RepID=UPI000C76C611|nr:hypothetical protein [Bacillus sp. V5-8f]PLT34059.1 hypothetical protein CUU64_10665 [Bacillus sp. V5-8f]